MNDYVKSDLMRYYGDYKTITFIRAILRSRTFRFQYALRLCQDKGLKKVIGSILWKLNRTKKFIQISKKTIIGYGLYIGHSGPIIINSNTKIGDNCNLSQFTTIGSNTKEGAIIQDNVYVGPNVCIIGNIKIGNNATIGAGSVVTKDIPENATAVGNYAKVINYNNPGRYIQNKWIIKN